MTIKLLLRERLHFWSYFATEQVKFLYGYKPGITLLSCKRYMQRLVHNTGFKLLNITIGPNLFGPLQAALDCLHLECQEFRFYLLHTFHFKSISVAIINEKDFHFCLRKNPCDQCPVPFEILTKLGTTWGIHKTHFQGIFSRPHLVVRFTNQHFNGL